MARETRTWALLIGLTLATAGLAAFDGPWVAAAMLALAWVKARAILDGFLHLDAAPGWTAAFALPLALWLAAVGVALAVVN